MNSVNTIHYYQSQSYLNFNPIECALNYDLQEIQIMLCFFYKLNINLTKFL